MSQISAFKSTRLRGNSYLLGVKKQKALLQNAQKVLPAKQRTKPFVKLYHMLYADSTQHKAVYNSIIKML